VLLPGVIQQRHQALSEIELAIDQPEEVIPVLVRINRIAVSVLAPTAGACLIILDKNERTFLIGDSTLPGLVPQMAIPRGTPLAKATQSVISNQESYVVAGPEFDAFDLNRMFPELHIQAYVATPLLRGTQVLGVLFVLDTAPRRYPPEDLEFLETIASRAAVAIARVSLYEKLWKANQLSERQRVQLESANQELTAAKERLAEANQELRESNRMLEAQSHELLLRNAELAQAKELAESASRTKSEFLQMMSHELRTPLSGVLGMANLLLYSELDSQQRDYLDTLKQSADTLLETINDILDFAQLQSGDLDLKPSDFNLVEAVTGLVGKHTPSAEAKNLELTCSISEDLPVQVRGDRERLEQILSKLLDNAVKFTDQGKVAVRVGVERQDDQWAVFRFDVTDTGIGVAPGNYDRLFEPFNPGDLSTTRRYSGTGLGLPLCQKLAQLMQGEISLGNSSGNGSTFHLRLTLEKQASAGHPLPRHVEPASLFDRRVPIVDQATARRRPRVATTRRPPTRRPGRRGSSRPRRARSRPRAPSPGPARRFDGSSTGGPAT
jgi:signal transduction histidine kinase